MAGVKAATIAGGTATLMSAATKATGAQHGKTGALKAAKATKRNINLRNKEGGYRNPTNYEFAKGSNKYYIKNTKKALNSIALYDIKISNILSFEANAYMSLIF